MHELALVRDLAVVWLAALVVGSIAVRCKLPAIAGYVIAGLVIGPFGMRLMAEPAQIKVLAELGVALLLFALGVELSVRKVIKAFGNTALCAVLQIGGTAMLGALIVSGANLVPNVVSGIVFGIICSLSSTAVVTKLLVERAETETLHGRAIVPILLFQDLSLVPVVAILPALNSSGNLAGAVGIAMVKALILIALVVAAAIYVVPRVMTAVVKTNSRELFLLTAISICLSVAMLSQALGISLALGAFLGGIMISERPHGRQVLADMTAITDLFSTLFFVSIGMLLDPMFIANHWVQVFAFVAFLLIGKASIGAVAAYTSTHSVWSAVLTGIAIAQIGEFSFVLATLAFDAKLLPKPLYNLFFAGSVITLAVSPVIIAAAPKLLSKVAVLRLMRRRERHDEHVPQNLKDHLVLVGFGRMGSSIGSTLHALDVPMLVVEIGGPAVERLASSGIPFIYGDAFQPFILEKAHLKDARSLVITIPDPLVASQIIDYARAQNPNLHVIVRASKYEYASIFHEHGADVVVQPEFEASIEATKMALLQMNRPQEDVLTAVRQIRQAGNSMFRTSA